MKLIIGFSGRENGNCDGIADYIASPKDTKVRFGNLSVHECSDCAYECFSGYCKYRKDDMYSLCASMLNYDKVFLLVPMYCGNPSSLYFKFSERCQDYFMHHEVHYEEIITKLYIIGVYGDRNKTPDFVPCLKKWFDGFGLEDHVLGIERHKFGQKIDDKILDIDSVKSMLDAFVGK